MQDRSASQIGVLYPIAVDLASVFGGVLADGHHVCLAAAQAFFDLHGTNPVRFRNDRVVGRLIQDLFTRESEHPLSRGIPIDDRKSRGQNKAGHWHTLELFAHALVQGFVAQQIGLLVVDIRTKNNVPPL